VMPKRHWTADWRPFGNSSVPSSGSAETHASARGTAAKLGGVTSWSSSSASLSPPSSAAPPPATAAAAPSPSSPPPPSLPRVPPRPPPGGCTAHPFQSFLATTVKPGKRVRSGPRMAACNVCWTSQFGPSFRVQSSNLGWTCPTDVCFSAHPPAGHHP